MLYTMPVPSQHILRLNQEMKLDITNFFLSKRCLKEPRKQRSVKIRRCVVTLWEFVRWDSFVVSWTYCTAHLPHPKHQFKMVWRYSIYTYIYIYILNPISALCTLKFFCYNTSSLELCGTFLLVQWFAGILNHPNTWLCHNQSVPKLKKKNKIWHR